MYSIHPNTYCSYLEMPLNIDVLNYLHIIQIMSKHKPLSVWGSMSTLLSTAAVTSFWEKKKKKTYSCLNLFALSKLYCLRVYVAQLCHVAWPALTCLNVVHMLFWMTHIKTFHFSVELCEQVISLNGRHSHACILNFYHFS